MMCSHSSRGLPASSMAAAVALLVAVGALAATSGTARTAPATDLRVTAPAGVRMTAGALRPADALPQLSGALPGVAMQSRG